MKAITREQVVEQLRKGQGKRTQMEYAKSLGISQQYLNDVYRGRRDPGPAILRLLGLQAAYAPLEPAVAS